MERENNMTDRQVEETMPVTAEAVYTMPEPLGQPKEFQQKAIAEGDPFAREDLDYHEDRSVVSSETRSLQEDLMNETGFSEYREGSIIKGTIIRITQDGVLVDICYKSEGFIPLPETGLDAGASLETAFAPGSQIDLKILRLNTPEGFVIVSKKAVDRESALANIALAFKEQTPVRAQVESAVKGGLIVTVNGHRGFLPASHLVRGRNEALDSAVGKTLDTIVIDFDRARKKIIVSQKKALSAGRDRNDAEKVIDTLEAGMVVKGKVSSIKNFGVFVDIGGIEGLIHVSELSWCRVKNPEEIVRVGQEIDVFILGVDKAGKKVSLGYKQLFPDPWVSVEDTYRVGDVVSGRVSRIVSFGAFVELEKGLEGLVHISEISDKNIRSIEEELALGEPVKVKVLRVIPEEKKIGLSIKAVQDMEIVHEYESAKKAEPETVTIGEATGFGDDNLTAISDEDDRLIEEVIEGAAFHSSDLAIDMDEVMNL